MSKNNHRPITGRSASPFYTKICFCLGIGDGIKKDGRNENAQNGNPPKIIDPLSDLDDDSINPVNEIGRLMREIAKTRKKERRNRPRKTSGNFTKSP